MARVLRDRDRVRNECSFGPGDHVRPPSWAVGNYFGDRSKTDRIWSVSAYCRAWSRALRASSRSRDCPKSNWRARAGATAPGGLNLFHDQGGSHRGADSSAATATAPADRRPRPGPGREGGGESGEVVPVRTGGRREVATHDCDGYGPRAGGCGIQVTTPVTGSMFIPSGRVTPDGGRSQRGVSSPAHRREPRSRSRPGTGRGRPRTAPRSFGPCSPSRGLFHTLLGPCSNGRMRAPSERRDGNVRRGHRGASIFMP